MEIKSDNDVTLVATQGYVRVLGEGGQTQLAIFNVTNNTSAILSKWTDRLEIKSDNDVTLVAGDHEVRLYAADGRLTVGGNDLVTVEQLQAEIAGLQAQLQAQINQLQARIH